MRILSSCCLAFLIFATTCNLAIDEKDQPKKLPWEMSYCYGCLDSAVAGNFHKDCTK